LRQTIVHDLDASLVVAGPAVGQIIAIDDCDYDVLELHALYGSGKLFRLIRIWRLWIAERLDAAEPATARALFPGDHERGRAARPAIVQIRAVSFLANRMQAMVRDRMMRGIQYSQPLTGG
jgi:hypothetical protein